MLTIASDDEERTSNRSSRNPGGEISGSPCGLSGRLRGQRDNTETSDLDLVVILDTLPQAYRESFVFGGWPVEAFVHDPQTLRYFFYEVDLPTGVPSLPTMVREGLELPRPNELSASLKQLAQTVIDAGPPWGEKEVLTSRYVITDLVDHMRAPVREMNWRLALQGFIRCWLNTTCGPNSYGLREVSRFHVACLLFQRSLERPSAKRFG